MMNLLQGLRRFWSRQMGFEREHKPSIGERSMSTAVTAVVHGIIFAVVALSSNSSQPEVQTAEETSVFCRYIESGRLFQTEVRAKLARRRRTHLRGSISRHPTRSSATRRRKTHPRWRQSPALAGPTRKLFVFERRTRPHLARYRHRRSPTTRRRNAQNRPTAHYQYARAF